VALRLTVGFDPDVALGEQQPECLVEGVVLPLQVAHLSLREAGGFLKRLGDSLHQARRAEPLAGSARRAELDGHGAALLGGQVHVGDAVVLGVPAHVAGAVLRHGHLH